MPAISSGWPPGFGGGGHVLDLRVLLKEIEDLLIHDLVIDFDQAVALLQVFEERSAGI